MKEVITIKSLGLLSIFTLLLLYHEPVFSQSEAFLSEHPTTQADWEDHQISLTWGPHASFEYSIDIQQAYHEEDTWHVYYSRSMPEVYEAHPHIETYPRALHSIDDPSTVGDPIQLYEIHDKQIFEDHTERETISKDKTFTLNFDAPINPNGIDEQGIQVVDAKGEEVEVITVMTESSEIKVLPPEEGYEANMFYEMYITNDWEAADGTELPNGYKLSFVAEEVDEDRLTFTDTFPFLTWGNERTEEGPEKKIDFAFTNKVENDTSPVHEISDPVDELFNEFNFLPLWEEPNTDFHLQNMHKSIPPETHPLHSST
ncbi:hypothetical protein [Salsuginibacillus kocurii]|uniref:hypothetical protein n=1 Tax=Salsuginibacillus kocurii TaxID=427078 RepID=UPI000361C7AB|nr:hypothetical protein [Salsuginibacillus kocurii]